MIIGQLDNRCEHFIRSPPRSNGTVDESGEFQMERVLASDEAIRIVAWHIRRVYFVHLMNLSRSTMRVKSPILPGDFTKVIPYPLHHGRGVGGQLVLPQANGTARPSLIRMLPTSFPSTRRTPQYLP